MQAIHPAIINGFIFCIVLLMGVIFDQYLLRWLRNGVLGTICIYVCDLFLPMTWQVGISVLTVLCAALFGIPGILILYLIEICFK